MRPIRLAALLALASLAGASDGAQLTLDEPAYANEPDTEKPEVPYLGKEVEPFALGAVGIGGEKRVNGSYVAERPNGELIDGMASLGFRRLHPSPRAVTVGVFMLFAGTDPLAAHDGRFLGGLAVAQGAWRGLVPLYDLRLGGGWSSERKGIIHADGSFGLLHLAAERDHDIHSYRIGAVLDGPPGLAPARIGIDRVIGYRDDSRDYATQTWIELGLPIREGVFLAGNGSYTFDAVDTLGHTDHVWEGWLGIGLRW